MIYLGTILVIYTEETIDMAVWKTGEKYRCQVCGNEVVVTKVGGGTLVCCSKDYLRSG